MNSNCPNLLELWETSRNKLKKTFCYQKLFWPFIVQMNCSSDVKIFAQILDLQPRISKSFSQSLEHFFLTVSQDNFGNKIPILWRQNQWIIENKTKFFFSFRLSRNNRMSQVVFKFWPPKLILPPLPTTLLWLTKVGQWLVLEPKLR